jgi:hypothetical protein
MNNRPKDPPTVEDGFAYIPRSLLGEFVGRVVHTDWARRGCIFRLEKVEGGRAHLITPKTHRRTIAAARSLMATREDSVRLRDKEIENGRL